MASPVTLEEGKAHLRVTHNQDDVLIADYLEASTEYVETISQRVFSTSTITKVLKAFPPGSSGIPLEYSPVESIDTITYYDQDGAQQSFDVSDVYFVENNVRLSCVFLDPGLSWPTTQSRPDAATITYSAGYGGDVNVPQAAKQAILFLLGHYYEQRMAVIVGTSQTELTFAVESLVSTLRPGTYANPDA